MNFRDSINTIKKRECLCRKCFNELCQVYEEQLDKAIEMAEYYSDNKAIIKTICGSFEIIPDGSLAIEFLEELK